MTLIILNYFLYSINLTIPVFYEVYYFIFTITIEKIHQSCFRFLKYLVMGYFMITISNFNQIIIHFAG